MLGAAPAARGAFALVLSIGMASSACRMRDGDLHEAPPGPRAAATLPAPPPARTAEGATAKPRLIHGAATGDVNVLVQREIEGAAREGRRVLVYVGATWCEPCQRFHAALEAGKLDASLPLLNVVEFDLDRDRERLAAAGYAPRLIPLFALPGSDGRSSGRAIEGGIKGDGAAGELVARLRALLGPA